MKRFHWALKSKQDITRSFILKTKLVNEKVREKEGRKRGRGRGGVEEGKRMKWEGERSEEEGENDRILQVFLAASIFCSKILETPQPGGRSLFKSGGRLNFNRNGSQAS